MPKTGSNVQVIGIVAPELRRALIKEAKRLDISLSHLVRRVLTAYEDGDFDHLKAMRKR